ncbi:hypothetical protein [Martelella sp. HB161492]|uniref:hypothetical protein n=1 Tax=Martelella sp. HB161492 TaxID=2720726 RepID=UPI00159162B2|nr:hypothetical protein [Martelella sp. HB161492]
MRFVVRMENRAWPYDTPPHDQIVEAKTAEEARRKALALDQYADILSVRPHKGE